MQVRANSVKEPRGPVVWPLLLMTVGLLLLLDNFLLLGPLDITALWPLLLVMAGVVILLRGDFTPDDSTRTFGITRGSVEAALLEVSAGDIDVRVQQPAREGRLIAGYYAPNARPSLQVDDVHTHLKLERAATPWIAFADWDLALAPDLPWQLLISTSLGTVDLNLDGLVIEGGVVATGFGDIRVVAPVETLVPLALRSSLGNIRLETPLGTKVRVRVAKGRLFKVHVDERRYVETEPGLYVSKEADPQAPLVDVDISGTFGDAYLA